MDKPLLGPSVCIGEKGLGRSCLSRVWGSWRETLPAQNLARPKPWIRGWCLSGQGHVAGALRQGRQLLGASWSRRAPDMGANWGGWGFWGLRAALGERPGKGAEGTNRVAWQVMGPGGGRGLKAGPGGLWAQAAALT